jgi:hypothetical protein
MNKTAVVFTHEKLSSLAGIKLGEQINEQLEGERPHVIILFLSSSYNYSELINYLRKTTDTDIVIGSSSAGEFTNSEAGTESASAVAIYSDEIQFNASLSKGIKSSRKEVAQELCTNFIGLNEYKYKYYTAMVFADALSGYTDELISYLTEFSAGTYQFFGGGAGDNENFNKTHVFLNDEIASDAAVVLEILSNKPVGVGVNHGWAPVGEKMKVTEADGMNLISLNATPAGEIYEEYAKSMDSIFDKANPIPFFLHNVLGIATEDGYKIRVPLALNPDNSITFASDIPAGSYVSFMSINNEAAKEAASNAARTALNKLEKNTPGVAFVFDCVATRLRMGNAFNLELDEIRRTLNSIRYAGCNTYGQVARVEGQFSGFHNCTAVVCILPE